jgi:membrane fusion protein (multidrug efflux system)
VQGRKPEAEPAKEEADDSEKKSNHRDKTKPPIYKRPRFILIGSAVLVVLVVAGILYWLHARRYVATDDAYIDGHVAQIGPQVSGSVLALHVDDNQFVHKGDLLVELDHINYQVAVQQSQAQLASAQARLNQAQAQIEVAQGAAVQTEAEVNAAQVALDNSTRDLQRYEAVDERALSWQQLDNAITSKKNAQAQLEQTKARKVYAEANVSTAEAQVKADRADVRTAEANLKRAEVDLGYCAGPLQSISGYLPGGSLQSAWRRMGRRDLNQFDIRETRARL